MRGRCHCGDVREVANLGDGDLPLDGIIDALGGCCIGLLLSETYLAGEDFSS